MNEMNYELENMNAVLFNRVDINKLVLAENENLNNFISKSILFYMLYELNHDVICDCHIIGIGNVDLFDQSARVVYIFKPHRLNEYQNKIDELYEYSEIEVIAINIEELPDDIFQRYLKLREYVFSH